MNSIQKSLQQMQAPDAEQLEQRAKELESNRSVPIEQILNPDFMGRHTRFASIEAFFEDGRFVVEKDEDFEALPQTALDQHARAVTPFDSFQEMVDKAVGEYIMRSLGF
ncbi:hypothetical protein ACH6EH_05410 [Paenibacillus sp. JSM ZJ436]|uniref:hypothetical protein n=1 Tax=Paenibacillus sp. JSM ZJ436 TaxID=3376190 RepID=UPI003795C189